MSKAMLLGFSIVSVASAGAALVEWENQRKAPWLPGETSHGHYQIELSCETCHVPFEGVSQKACIDCHGEDLERSDDSHPAAKFKDPRNADLLATMDALRCVTCHVEHRPERTAAMGVTQPQDFCFHCHADIGEERASHVALPFDGCAAAGCHNFHDNRTLHADYLAKHLDVPATLRPARLPSQAQARTEPARILGVQDADAPVAKLIDVDTQHWAASAHAQAAVNCSACHGAGDGWAEAPQHGVCGECHERQVSGFVEGHHGMRLHPALTSELAPMTPAQARLPMRAERAHESIGCQSCHGAHDYDRHAAAVDACLTCHADDHSLAYKASKHFELWQAERSGAAEVGSGVSCATCHMPRLVGGVEHNQNDNLRPNEKMISSVCSHCHGVGFALDALADRAVIERGMSGLPTVHVDSLEMVRQQLGGRAPKPDAADR